LNFELRLFLKALRYSGLLKLWLSSFLHRKESNLSKLDEEFFIFTLEKALFWFEQLSFRCNQYFENSLVCRYLFSFFYCFISVRTRDLERLNSLY